MKTMKLLPLKIAVTSAMMVGLGMASTANAQQQKSPKTEIFLPNLFDNDNTELTDPLYHNMILGNTALLTQENQYKFYADDGNDVPDSLLFNKILHDQLLHGFKEGDTIIPLDENGKPVYKLDSIVEQGKTKTVYSVTTKIATRDDVEQSAYSRGIQGDIDDLYEANKENVNRLIEHGDKIFANEESVQYLNKEVQNNIENIHELAQQQDQHSSDIKTLKKNVEEGLLELSGHLIDQKADLTKDIKTLESNVEEGLLDLSGRLIDQKADIAKNQADIQLHDKKITNLGILHSMVARAVGNNTQGVATNKADIAKNQADIANNINNIYELAQQQDQHSSDIKTLAKVSAANTDRIAKNKAEADASFETLTKNQNTLIEKDKEHDKLITANKTAIDANKASADTKFAATADAITKNGNAITKNAKSITDLGTKVDAFDGRVTALDTKVNALDTKVNAFDGRITALDSKVENGMAAQAALSGLFQPYSVGKFNATAALGGYGSKSAVAIGAGYRVNPNLAFKAGAAINTSGNKKGSYNIGVNYEF